MYRYFIWVPIGGLSFSYLYLTSKGLYNGINNKNRPNVNNFYDIIYNKAFIFGGLIGFTYVYLNQPILNYILNKYITK